MTPPTALAIALAGMTIAAAAGMVVAYMAGLREGRAREKDRQVEWLARVMARVSRVTVASLMRAAGEVDALEEADAARGKDGIMFV